MMNLKKHFLLLFLGILTTTQICHGATLVVKLENMSEKGGNTMVALFSNKEYWLGLNARGIKQPAEAPTTSVRYENVEPGTYGITVMQDIDKNMTLNLNEFGLPMEPYGFSNDAPTRHGPPTWEDASFEVSEGTNEITIYMH